MAFLDNSGDIILDAVLTDTGRLRLAKGDGSFNITKFALGDDEINYEDDEDDDDDEGLQPVVLDVLHFLDCAFSREEFAASCAKELPPSLLLSS